MRVHRPLKKISPLTIFSVKNERVIKMHDQRIEAFHLFSVRSRFFHFQRTCWYMQCLDRNDRGTRFTYMIVPSSLEFFRSSYWYPLATGLHQPRRQGPLSGGQERSLVGHKLCIHKVHMKKTWSIIFCARSEFCAPPPHSSGYGPGLHT